MLHGEQEPGRAILRCVAAPCTVHGAAPVADGSGAFPGEMRRVEWGDNVWVSSVCGASTVRVCFSFSALPFVYFLSSIVYCLFLCLCASCAFCGAAARQRANQSMCVRAIVCGHIFFLSVWVGQMGGEKRRCDAERRWG